VSRERKRRISTWIGLHLVNPVVRWMLERGIAPRSHALLETIGRKSGQPRRTPVGNGLRGPITERIQKEFFAYIAGEIPDRFGWFTPVHAERAAEARKPALAAR